MYMNNSSTKSNNKKSIENKSLENKYLLSILNNNKFVSRYKAQLKNMSNKEKIYLLDTEFNNIEVTVDLISKFLEKNNEKVTLDNIILILDNLYNKKITKFLLFKLFFLKINKQFKKFKSKAKNNNARGIIHNLRNMILFYLCSGDEQNNLDKELITWFKENFKFDQNTSNIVRTNLLNKDIKKFIKILQQIKLIDNIYDTQNDNIRIELSKIDCFKYLSNEYSINNNKLTQNNNKLTQNIVIYFNKAISPIKVMTNSEIKKININNTLSSNIKNDLKAKLKSNSTFRNAFHNLLILTKQFFDTNTGRNTAGGHAFEINGLNSSLAVITFLDYWNKSNSDIKIDIVKILEKQEDEQGQNKYTGCTDGMINRINDLLTIKNIPYVNINTNRMIIKKYFNKKL